MKIITVLALVAILIFLIKTMMFSFRAQTPAQYAGTGPQFNVLEHLSGPILSEGLIFGPTGKMTNSFVAQMHGEWTGTTGTLTEDFTYSNGRTQARKWNLQLGEGGRISATADDIVGTAEGTITGSTIMLRYRIILPAEVGGHKLDVTDWMYLTENGVIMNRSEMRMFGIKVAELVATMRPDPVAQ